jgi:hypothetical protein
MKTKGKTRDGGEDEDYTHFLDQVGVSWRQLSERVIEHMCRWKREREREGATVAWFRQNWARVFI